MTIPSGATLNTNDKLTNNGDILISGGTLNGTVSGTPAHQPVSETREYGHNATHHFTPCVVDGCDEKTGNERLHEYFNAEPHSYNQQVVDDTYKASGATCTEPASIIIPAYAGQ